jgi:Putative ABC exporter
VLVWVGAVRLSRLMTQARRGAGAPLALLPLLAVFVPGAYLVLLGIAVARSAVRAPAAFRSPADARFLIGSRLPQRLVVAWLLLRRTLGLMLVSLFNVVLIVAFLPLGGDSTPQLALLFCAIAGAYVTVQALPMATYLLGRRASWLPLTQLGVATAALGAASLVLAFLQRVDVRPALPEGLAGPLLALPPGQWIRDAYHGQAIAVAWMIAAAAVAVALTVRLSNDAYPELWESSSRLFTLRALARQRGGLLQASEVRRALGELRGRSVASASGLGVPSGAGAILWKEWLALRRAPNALAVQLGLTAAAALAGVVVGLLLRQGELRLAVTIVMLGGMALLGFNVYAGFRIGGELRNPVWWLSAAGVRGRLLAWTVAGALRQAVPAAAGLALALGIAGDYGLLAASLVAAPVVPWGLRLVALASYALVPSATDLRGPGRLLRVLLLQLFVAPPTVVLLVLTLVTGSLAAGCLAAAAVALGEGWLLLELAAWLIGRNGLAYVRAEAR